MYHRRRHQRVSGSVIPLGFILVIGIITIVAAAVSTTVVPALNQEAEVNAHRAAATDFFELDTTVFRAATTGAPQPVTMADRVDYPITLSRNTQPSPHLRTVGQFNMSVDGAVYASNSSSFTETRATTQLLYNREYNQYTDSRLLGYEHGVFYTQPKNTDEGDAGAVVRNTQPLIDDERITLVALDGDFSVSNPATTQLALSPTPSAERHATITNKTTGKLSFTIPTRLPKAAWKSSLEDERVVNGGHVESIDYQTTNPDTGTDNGMHYLILTMESGVTYNVNYYTVEIDQRN